LSFGDAAFLPARGPVAVEHPRATGAKRAAARLFNFIEHSIRNCAGYRAVACSLCVQTTEPVRKQVSIRKKYGGMSEIPVILFRLSVSVVAFAVKGNQGGIVQQQIEAMGLRQWLSLVAAWIAERVYSEAARLRDFIAPLLPAFDLKLVSKESRAVFFPFRCLTYAQ
jgi:hypothetical protein